jgi:hypothetical protein
MPLAIGKDPAIDDVMVVLEARLWRRRLRVVARVGVLTIAVVIVGLEHLLLNCDARQYRARDRLLALSAAALASSSAPKVEAATADGYRYVVTDVVAGAGDAPDGDGAGKDRFLIWAFSVDGDNSVRVVNEAGTDTAAMDGCRR